MKIISKKTIVVAIIAVVSLIGIYALAPDNQTKTNPSNRTVMATIFPLYDMTSQIAGEALDVRLILAPGSEPHTFEPTPDTAMAVSQSAVVYAIGHGFDSWLNPLATASKVDIVVPDAGIDLMASSEHEEESKGEDADEHTGDGYDPHYWISIRNAKIMATNIATDLSSRFPESSATFRSNLDAYIGNLDAADREIQSILSTVKNNRFATFHGAFGYFARDYGLEVSATFEPFPGREPSARYLAELSEHLANSGTNNIYYEPSFNPKAVESFASDNALTIAELDPLGGTAGRFTLYDTLIHNANVLAKNQR